MLAVQESKSVEFSNGEDDVSKKKKPNPPGNSGDDEDIGHVVDISKLEKRRIRGQKTSFAKIVMNLVQHMRQGKVYAVPTDRLKKESTKIDSFRATLKKLADRMGIEISTWVGPDENGVMCFMIMKKSKA